MLCILKFTLADSMYQSISMFVCTRRNIIFCLFKTIGHEWKSPLYIFIHRIYGMLKRKRMPQKMRKIRNETQKCLKRFIFMCHSIIVIHYSLHENVCIQHLNALKIVPTLAPISGYLSNKIIPLDLYYFSYPIVYVSVYFIKCLRYCFCIQLFTVFALKISDDKKMG